MHTGLFRTIGKYCTRTFHTVRHPHDMPHDRYTPADQGPQAERVTALKQARSNPTPEEYRVFVLIIYTQYSILYQCILAGNEMRYEMKCPVRLAAPPP